MAAPSNDALKRQVEAVFGTALSDAEIESGKGRLPTMLENARLLEEWAGQLGAIGPSQVLQVAEASAPKVSGDD